MSEKIIEIRLDDVGTWPASLMAHFERQEDLLRKYRDYERKLFDDRAWGPTYVPMALRPSNPFHPEREVFLSTLRSDYADKLALRGFHCTRLTDDEAAIVIAEGMTPPNLSILCSRISAIENAGLISRTIADRLMQDNSANCPTREGRIWFIFTVPPLKSCTGVGDLFRYWGGEALYGRHDTDPEVGPLLASIGRARIIEAVIPLRDMASFPDTQMVQQFLVSRGVSVSNDRDFVDRTTTPIPASRIRRILSRSDKEFVTLTGCAKWRPQIV